MNEFFWWQQWLDSLEFFMMEFPVTTIVFVRGSFLIAHRYFLESVPSHFSQMEMQTPLEICK